MLRAQQFPPNCTQQEYVYNVDQIANYWDSPDISISMHLPKEVTEMLTGLTAVGLEERWHVEKIFDFVWVNFQRENVSRVGFERVDDFVGVVQDELLECQKDGDEEEEESEDDGSRKEAEMKEVVEEYVQYYEEAKALQEKNQGRRRSRARKMSLSECYFEVMSSKNVGGHLHGYLQQDSGLTDSLVSESLTDCSATEFGDVQRTGSEELPKQRPLVHTKSMPNVNLNDVIASLAHKWGHCLRRKNNNVVSFKV
eukprot:TRINITY_DN21338_c0_g1_i4.p1 TRINITY_DN21338_c0_g1~~TRINITY_DN21338_c0_g1_i4.p1  ORF type:complete len:270 (-),score=51.08 TRINITY_DN21338_c0_g1_i4:503-1264(-)